MTNLLATGVLLCVRIVTPVLPWNFMKCMTQEVCLSVVLLIASCEDVQQVQAAELTTEDTSYSSSLDVKRSRVSCLITVFCRMTNTKCYRSVSRPLKSIFNTLHRSVFIVFFFVFGNTAHENRNEDNSALYRHVNKTTEKDQ